MTDQPFSKITPNQLHTFLTSTHDIAKLLPPFEMGAMLLTYMQYARDQGYFTDNELLYMGVRIAEIAGAKVHHLTKPTTNDNDKDTLQ